MKYSKTLSFNLKLLRRYHGLSGQDLSERLGMPYGRIYGIENGAHVNIRKDELQAICAFFNVTTEDLLHKKATIIFE